MSFLPIPFRSRISPFRALMFMMLTSGLTLQVMAQSGGVRSWTYVQFDDHKAKWGDWNAPDWLRYFGLDTGDIDGDGRQEIVGGGRWFDYQDGRFIENIIDASYTFTRAAAGQLIEGGRPEVVLVVGDGVGPLVLYEWREGFWISTILLAEVDNGHTLDVVDFDNDGHLDIFNAEMRIGEGNPDAEVRILLGDGKGSFRKHVVARGFGVHEGRLVDLDGDGDLDVLGKPYAWKAPLLNIWLQVNK